MTKKVMSRATLGVLFGVLCLGVGDGFAGGMANSELSELKAQIEDLQQRNEELSSRLQAAEEGLAGQDARIQAQEEKIGEQDERVAAVLDKINEHVALSGVIEGDLVFSGDYAGDDTSEIVLSNVELGFDVTLADWATAFALIKYDGDEDDLLLDEGYLTLGKTEAYPVYLTLGKLVVPFGDYSTNMLQDPLTQTLGEINEGAVVLGVEKAGVSAAVFGYNGIDEIDDSKEINGLGVALRYDYEQEGGLGLSIGAGWVNNLASAGGISDALPRTEEDEPQLTDSVSGMNAHAGISYGGFSALVEYTAALDSFDVEDLAFGDSGAEPKALGGELAYTADIQGFETTFALGAQKSWEALALELPELRYSVAVAVGILEGATVTLEYYYDEDYDIGDGGTGDNGYGFTTRLAYEF